MLRPPPIPPLTHTLLPSPALFRSAGQLRDTRLRGLERVPRDHPLMSSDRLDRDELGKTLGEPDRHVVVSRTHRHMGQLVAHQPVAQRRSEEHTSELQSLMRISYAVFCLKKKKQNKS